jgi:large subunit ribosomal protein L35
MVAGFSGSGQSPLYGDFRDGMPGAEPMPKQKTHKGTKKRFRLTAKGKAKHRQAGTSHLAARKSKKRRRNLRGTKVVSSTVLKQIHRALAASSG